MSDSNDLNTYDLIVIGTGGAAMAAGIEARERGKTVLLVEHNVLGGTCLNVGCVPSKRLLAASGTATPPPPTRSPPRRPAPPGSTCPRSSPRSSSSSTRCARRSTRPSPTPTSSPSATATPASPTRTPWTSTGRSSPHQRSSSPPGPTPATPDLPGIDTVDFLTSTTAMEQTELPESLVVLGAGYVGLEQSQLWSQLGVPVTIVGRFAPHTEPELASLLKDAFTTDGITVIEQRASSVAATTDGVTVTTEQGQRITAARLLVATGRRPSTEDLGLDAAGVKTDDRGFVIVDDYQRTSNDRVWAAGDVSGAPQYVYVAAQTGHVAAANALGEPQTMDYRGLPGVTFTTPQLASAGLTEQQALDQGHSCDCGPCPPTTSLGPWPTTTLAAR